MRQELDEKLCKSFPNLYRDRWESSDKTEMCWGFECSDGWYDLIYNLSIELEQCICEMPKEERAGFKAVQVKEKFGRLRFYLSQVTHEMFDLIDAATEESGKICEDCGLDGKTRDTSWIRTLCEECLDKYRLQI